MTDPIFDIPEGFPRLLAVMRRLRDPETGCPWDIEQTYATIAPYTIEEAFEVADAVEREDWQGLEGELGDLLFQVIFHGQMGAEAGHFDINSIARNITDKMIARHPHIFGDESRDKTAEQQARDWETVKEAERTKIGAVGALDDVALGLPALMRALKLQKRAARVGFDWTEIDDVLAKVGEEIGELAQARTSQSSEKIAEEYGDLLFILVNVGRHLKVDPEEALRAANAKFTRRFQHIEGRLAEAGRTPRDSDLEEMDALWDEAKALGK